MSNSMENPIFTFSFDKNELKTLVSCFKNIERLNISKTLSLAENIILSSLEELVSKEEENFNINFSFEQKDIILILLNTFLNDHGYDLKIKDLGYAERINNLFKKFSGLDHEVFSNRS